MISTVVLARLLKPGDSRVGRYGKRNPTFDRDVDTDWGLSNATVQRSEITQAQVSMSLDQLRAQCRCDDPCGAIGASHRLVLP